MQQLALNESRISNCPAKHKCVQQKGHILLHGQLCKTNAVMQNGPAAPDVNASDQT